MRLRIVVSDQISLELIGRVTSRGIIQQQSAGGCGSSCSMIALVVMALSSMGSRSLT